jgi:phage tail-like protein
MEIEAPNYPYLNLQFRLTVGDEVMGEFSECTGLSLELTTEDFHEGGENRFVHRFPAVGQIPNLVLKRGISTSNALWEWLSRYVERGEVDVRDGQVELLGLEDDELKPVRAWAFTRGYPVKWTGPELNALSPSIAFETLELVHRGVRTAVPD